MTEAASLSFSGKEVLAVATALFAVLFAGADYIVDFKSGAAAAVVEDASIKKEIVNLRKTIDSEHRTFRSTQNQIVAELAEFKIIEAERHSNEAISIGQTKTEARYMQRDLDKILKSMESLHHKVDEHSGNGRHPPIP